MILKTLETFNWLRSNDSKIKKGFLDNSDFFPEVVGPNNAIPGFFKQDAM